MQQPLPDRTSGALIGKVREKVEVIEDKQTGEKTSRDIGEVFFIGKENRLRSWPPGRLLLGVNENVTARQRRRRSRSRSISEKDARSARSRSRRASP